jgi:HlyD family secretion protein
MQNVLVQLVGKRPQMDRVIEKRKWTPKRITWMSLTALFVILVVRFVVFGDHSSRLNVRAERVTISTVRKGEFLEFINVTGTVIPIKTIYLDAIEGGRIDSIFLEAGTYVNKGDRILKLANTNLLLDIMYREAELFQQSNNLRNTRLAMDQNRLTLRGQLLELNYQIKKQQRIYQQYEELIGRGLASDQQYQDAKDEYQYLVAERELTLETHRQDSIYRAIQIKQLQASLERMEANLQVVKQNLENLTIKAPVSGHLTSLNAEFGESKARGERLGQIDVLDGFKVRVAIDEHYIARINIGQKGEFTLADEDYELVISKIYPEVVNGRFEVDLEFVSGEPEDARRGQSLHIRLELGDLEEAVLLDRGGFYQSTGGQWVYVLDENGDFAVKRRVGIGRQNPEAFEVLDGLEPGEKVITSSYDSYGDVDKLILKR